MIQNKIMEDIHLDYKLSKALEGKPGEISKDVSAFANSDGGMIIYGIDEEQHFPTRLDDGVDHAKFTRERLENIILSNITPIPDGIEIIQIPINDQRSYYAVCTPKSVRGPHQDKQHKRYYKRHNFSSTPMEDYEIQDIRNRQLTYPSLLNIDIAFDRGTLVLLCIENPGLVPAKDITFKVSKPLNWSLYRQPPSQLEKGIRSLPPGKKLSFHYCSVFDAYKESADIVRSFEIEASYFHPISAQCVTDIFNIDLDNYEGTSILHSDLHHHGKRLEDSLKKVASELQNLNKRLEKLETIAGPTGINLSVTTMRNLAGLLKTEAVLQKLAVEDVPYQAFEEVLGISSDLAFKLSTYFQYRNYSTKNERLEDLDGMTPEILDRLNLYFKLNQN